MASACIVVPVLLLLTVSVHSSVWAIKTADKNYKIKLLDETEASNPKSFDYNFDDDIVKIADKNDIYDEFVPYLPPYTLHKNGKNMGKARIPITTRKMAIWSTQPPPTKKGDKYKEWFTTTPLPFNQRRLTPTIRPLINKKASIQRLTTTTARSKIHHNTQRQIPLRKSTTKQTTARSHRIPTRSGIGGTTTHRIPTTTTRRIPNERFVPRLHLTQQLLLANRFQTVAIPNLDKAVTQPPKSYGFPKAVAQHR